MVCVGVNKDGTEIICERELTRFIPGNPITHAVCSVKVLMDNKPCWIPKVENSECGTYGLIVNLVTLPKGSIKRLIGRELTWEDECVIIEDYERDTKS